jgi:aryl-alcohol dehydrogenase-like predicted oxidoreductase
MRYTTFGPTGLSVSEIAVGTWGIGGIGWGGQDEQDSIEAVRTALAAGVNLIDTAPIYGFGIAEEVLGRALEGVDRSSYYIATKFGVTWPEGPGTGLVQNGSRDNILRELDLSQKSLGLDYIDLYIHHWPDTDTQAPLSETFGTLQALKDEGRIGHVGVSNYSQELIEEARQYTAVEVLQVQHSMLVRDNEPVMAWAIEQGLGTMAWAPLAAGMLTGKYRTLPSFDESDWRRTFYPFFAEPAFSKAQALLPTLDAIAATHATSVTAVTENWSTQHPLVTTALAGMRSAKQAQENTAALDWSLTPEEIAEIDAAIAATQG